MIVKLWMTKSERSEDEGNHDENLQPKRISYASQLTMSNMAGITARLARKTTEKRYSQPNHAGHIANFSHPLVSSNLVSIFNSHLSSLSWTLQSSDAMKLSHPSLSLHVMIMCWHWVQHQPKIDCLLLPASLSNLTSQCTLSYSTLHNPTITS